MNSIEVYWHRPSLNRDDIAQLDSALLSSYTRLKAIELMMIVRDNYLTNMPVYWCHWLAFKLVREASRDYSDVDIFLGDFQEIPVNCRLELRWRMKPFWSVIYYYLHTTL